MTLYIKVKNILLLLFPDKEVTKNQGFKAA